MRSRRSAVLIPLLLVSALGAAAPTVTESWIAENSGRELQKLVVIGLTDDQEARHHFEDKFVSHLRGHGLGAVTSYSLVPDLQNLEDRVSILDRVTEQHIDGAISVRLIPLGKNEASDWSSRWMESTEKDLTLRAAIEAAFPATSPGASRFGLEIDVWRIESRHRVWAGRTGAHKMKQLRASAGDLIETVVGTLEDARLLR